MSRGDRNSASSSRGSLSGFFSAGNKSANATPVDAQQRLNDPNLTKSLPMIDLPSPTSGGSGDRSMHRSESSPQSRGTPMSAPTTMRVPRIGETGISVVTAGSPTRHRTPPTSGSSLPSSAVSATGAPMISLDTIPSASEAATGERSTLALASLADVFRSDGSLAVELSPLPDDEEARDSGPARG